MLEDAQIYIYSMHLYHSTNDPVYNETELAWLRFSPW